MAWWAQNSLAFETMHPRWQLALAYPHRVNVAVGRLPLSHLYSGDAHRPNIRLSRTRNHRNNVTKLQPQHNGYAYGSIGQPWSRNRLPL